MNSYAVSIFVAMYDFFNFYDVKHISFIQVLLANNSDTEMYPKLICNWDTLDAVRMGDENKGNHHHKRCTLLNAHLYFWN